MANMLSAADLTRWLDRTRPATHWRLLAQYQQQNERVGHKVAAYLSEERQASADRNGGLLRGSVAAVQEVPNGGGGEEKGGE